MELIYSMRRKPLKFPPPHFENSLDSGVIRSICTISSANIIAFSSPTELSDSDGNTWAGHVYVCDLDTPWDSHKVTSTSYSVSALEWDNEGKQLLVATTEGDVSVYGQKDYLLNEWQCLYTAQFPGEHIIKAVFFHNGRRFVMMDKKPDAPITERIQMTRSTPTLKGFGGVACEGAVVLTSSGLVAALVAADGPRALLASEPLRSRHHILCADLAHKAGNVIVAAAGKTAVRCYVCAVTRSPGRPPAAALQVQPLPTVFLPVDHAPPVSVTWCLREDTDSLMIASNKLSLWKLTERSHPVHKLLAKGTLQGSTTPGGGQKQASDCFNTVAWVQAGTVAVEGRAVQAACGRPAPAPPLALLATARALHLLARDSHHYVCSRQVVTTGSGEPAGAATPPKKPKYGPGLVNDGNGGQAVVSSVQISSLGGVAVCVDSHAQLHVFRLPQPWADIPSPMSLQQATSVLEYAMVSGYDCLDVLLTLKPNMMETVYERLTESFQRQPQHFQQYYYHSWLKLRTALCRAVPTWQNGAAWLATVGWLHAAAAAAASAVPALAALPHHHHHHAHGYDILTDPSALCLLRKLVVVARGGEALSRPLARLATAAQPKQDLLDECAALCAQRGGARVWDALPRCAVSAPHQRPWPLHLEYGVEPEALRYNPEPPAYAQGDTTPSTNMDSIRYMYLPARPALQRAHDARFLPACRCGGKWTLFSNV